MEKDGIEDLKGKTVLKNLFRTDSESDNWSSDEEKVEETSVTSTSMPSSSSVFTSSTSGLTVSIYEEKLKGIAFQLWPAAKLFCDYIDEHIDDAFISSHTSSNSAPTTNTPKRKMHVGRWVGKEGGERGDLERGG